MSYCSIAEHFNRYFELVMADTPELKREVYSIRYRVYCEELSYESTDKFPDGLEKDAYDDHSIHYLLKHRPSGLYAGCVRIVLPTVKEDYQPIFPSQAVFPNHFDLIGRHKTEFCEISRLAVLSEFRKPKLGDIKSEGILFCPSNQNQIKKEKKPLPLISFSLYCIAFSTALAAKLDGLAIMEPRLARHLKRCSIISYRIGNLVDYRGKRGLFMMKSKELIKNLDDSVRELFNLINYQVRSQLCYSRMRKCGLRQISEIESNSSIAYSTLFAIPLHELSDIRAVC